MVHGCVSSHYRLTFSCRGTDGFPSQDGALLRAVVLLGTQPQRHGTGACRHRHSPSRQPRRNRFDKSRSSANSRQIGRRHRSAGLAQPCDLVFFETSRSHLSGQETGQAHSAPGTPSRRRVPSRAGCHRWDESNTHHTGRHQTRCVTADMLEFWNRSSVEAGVPAAVTRTAESAHGCTGFRKNFAVE